jgi:hypothetical protein
MSNAEIQQMLKKHEAWIHKHMKMVEERAEQREEQQETLPPYTRQEIQAMAEQAMERIPPRVRRYAAQIGVTYGRITIRNQKTRWGSCSSKGNLNFNCLLTQVPERVMDYVIIHELCHRIEMNHSGKFWALVEQYMPDYQVQKQWLKENGSGLINRMIG